MRNKRNQAKVRYVMTLKTDVKHIELKYYTVQ